MDQWAQQISQEHKHVSYDDALEGLRESGTILDFQLGHRRDPRFGATWVTYEGGFNVHVRVTGESAESFAKEIAGYEAALGHRVIVHSGGASGGDLWNFAETVATEGLKVSYALYDVEGFIQIYSDTDVAQIPQFFPREFLQLLSTSPPNIEAAGGWAGEDRYWWTGSTWSADCTAGFMWGTYATSGFVTAGHCSNATVPNPSSLGGTWTSDNTFQEHCYASGTDYQAHRFSAFNNPGEQFVWKSTNPPTYIGIKDMAGGYYVGQSVAKVGNWANITRTSTGFVLNPAMGSGMVSGGDCAPATTNNNLRTDTATVVGDSGGPLSLWYAVGGGGGWYGASITSGVTPDGVTWSTWAGWIPVSTWYSANHWCTYVNPCGPID